MAKKKRHGVFLSDETIEILTERFPELNLSQAIARATFELVRCELIVSKSPLNNDEKFNEIIKMIQNEKKLKLVIVERMYDIYCSLYDNSKVWDCGNTEEEAIGKWIKTHGKDYGIIIVKEQQNEK